MNEVSLQLTTMRVTKEEFPSNDIALIQKPEWSLSFLNDYNPGFSNKWHITVTMSYRLKDNGEQKAFLEMFNIFNIGGDLDEETKLEVLQLVLEQTSANLQGIWAAKTEEQPAMPLPPLYIPENYVAALKEEVSLWMNRNK
jgi:hypothetical protein